MSRGALVQQEEHTAEVHQDQNHVVLTQVKKKQPNKKKPKQKKPNKKPHPAVLLWDQTNLTIYMKLHRN